MNTLKAKTKIRCSTCGCSMNRVKSISVMAASREEAIQEAQLKINEWRASLEGANCKVCASIIKSLDN